MDAWRACALTTERVSPTGVTDVDCGEQKHPCSLLLLSHLPLILPLAEPNCKLEGLGAWKIQHRV